MLPRAHAQALHPDPRRVMVADPHPLVVEGLARVLDDAPDLRVVHRSHSGAELLEALLHEPADLLILDSRLSNPTALDVLESARRQGIGTAAIFLATSPRDEEILDAIRLGIRGLVTKDAPIQSVLDCVRNVLSGGTCMDQALVGRAMATMLTREAALRQFARQLTARELEVVQLVASGQHNREIAARLFVSDGTLKVHLHHIYEKLHVSSREDLIALARARGLSSER